MTTPVNAETRINEPDAEQVAEFLNSHPDFFDDQAELLSQLRLPHPSGTAVSLIERQIQVLRDQNQDLKTKLLELVDVARDNDRLNERMHRLTLDLLKSGSLMELLDTLQDHLRTEFKADAITVLLPDLEESQRRETGAENLVIDEALKSLFPIPFSEGKPQCGRLKQEQVDFLFRDQAAAIESTAVVPLGDRAQTGLLAIGSREVNRFNPCMGTLFLSHLGELLSQLLQNHDTAWGP
jgi:uncharacterized protein YigA (DUF484 family)